MTTSHLSDAGHTPRHGWRKGTGKLTEDDVRAIRAAAGKERQSALAAKYGVTQQTISGIQRGESWRYI